VWPGKQAEVDELAGSAVSALEQIFVDRAVRPQVLPDGRERARYREALALPHLAKLATSLNAAVRASTGTMLGNVDDRGAEVVLERLLSDRDPTVRIAAAESLALRAEYVPDATLAALEAALRGGRRELVLPAPSASRRRSAPKRSNRCCSDQGRRTAGTRARVLALDHSATSVHSKNCCRSSIRNRMPTMRRAL